MQTCRVIFTEFVTTHSVVKVLLRQHASLLGAHKQTASITSITQPWSIQLETYDIWEPNSRLPLKPTFNSTLLSKSHRHIR